MKAARLHGVRDVRIDDIPEPHCEKGCVKIRPRFNGLCGSDMHFFTHEAMVQSISIPHPLTGEKMPTTLGHEFSGVITEVGSDVRSLAVGDHVAVQPIFSDGVCNACLRGSINCCRQIGFRGLHGGGGGLSGAVVVPETSAFKLPESIDYDVGALVEPLSVGWHAVRIATGSHPPRAVLVQGGGPIGCAVTLALLAKGIRNVFVAEPNQARIDLIKELGPKLVIDPKKDDVADKVLQLTDGSGVDVVFDCAGVPSTMNSGCRALASLGTFVNLAVWSEPASIDATNFVMKELTYKGSLAYTPQDFRDVIQALADGTLEPKRMITKRIALSDVVKEGFEALLREGNAQCKVLVDLSM